MRNHQLFRFVLLALGLASIVLLSRSAEAAPGLLGWHWETVGPGGYVSLAYDGAGQPRVAYTYTVSEGVYELKYAVRGAAGWDSVTAASGYYVGFYPALAVDAAGYPHISHHSGASPAIYYTFQDADGWHTETIVTGMLYANDTTPLALDPQGRPHVTYQTGDGAETHVVHAVRVAGVWQADTVYTCPRAPFVGCSHLDMALDAGGVPHFAFTYSGSTGTYVMVAAPSGDGWAVERAAGPFWPIDQLSLSLDGSGQPYVSHSSSGDLRYTFRDSAGWHTELLTSGWRGLYNDLAVSTSGVPHLAYYDRQSANLHYAYRDGAGWHDLILDGSGWVGHFPSIALYRDYPGIAYLDPSDTGPQLLRYAYLTPLDVQPNVFPNVIDLGSDEKVLLVVLGTPDLDVLDLDPLTVRFGPGGAPPAGSRAHYKDADQDGDLDLALAFWLRDASIPCGATRADLFAQTYAGESFVGWDDIVTAGCED